MPEISCEGMANGGSGEVKMMDCDARKTGLCRWGFGYVALWRDAVDGVGRVVESPL